MRLISGPVSRAAIRNRKQMTCGENAVCTLHSVRARLFIASLESRWTFPVFLFLGFLRRRLRRKDATGRKICRHLHATASVRKGRRSPGNNSRLFIVMRALGKFPTERSGALMCCADAIEMCSLPGETESGARRARGGGDAEPRCHFLVARRATARHRDLIAGTSNSLGNKHFMLSHYENLLIFDAEMSARAAAETIKTNIKICKTMNRVKLCRFHLLRLEDKATASAIALRFLFIARDFPFACAINYRLHRARSVKIPEQICSADFLEANSLSLWPNSRRIAHCARL